MPLDDLINLLEGLRLALPSVVDGKADADGNAAIDAAIEVTAGTGGSLETPASGTRSFSSCTRAPDLVTIKWVQQDPLVMNGEPFCYGSRLTVRQLLELRSSGYDLPADPDRPSLSCETVGVAAAFRLRKRPPRSLRGILRARRLAQGGPVTGEAEAAGLPVQYRLPGVVVKAV